MNLQELAEMFTRTHHHGFPVLDQAGHFYGLVTVQDLERATDHDPVQAQTVADIAAREVITVSPVDALSTALHYMSDRDVGRLPVVDPEDPTRLVGLLRRQNIVRAYRSAILNKLESQHRRENLRLGYLTETEILEIPLGSGMTAVGRRIKDLHLPAQALITSVRRDDQVLIAHGETMFQPGDTVVVLVRKDAVEVLRQELTGVG
jgi:CIC family chloride channel protein